MRSDGEFEAGTGGPTRIGRASAGKAGSRGLDIAESATGGDVGHESSSRVAKPSAYCRKPGITGPTSGRAASGGGTTQSRPIDIAFDAKHRGADLVIIAKRAAGDPAARIERIGRVPLRIAEAAAAIVDGQLGRSLVVRRGGQVGRPGRP
jgi:hypothetical protein